MNKTEIAELFKAFGAAISQDDVWQVQAATVIKHKALERLAAAAKIEFGPPQIIRADRDEAVILATGTLGGRTEWSIGEALVNVNYRVSGRQAAYVYAMAEKRAKDRVIIKLAGLHGIYSEDEADEFQQPNSAQTAAPVRNAGAGNAAPHKTSPAPAPDSLVLAALTASMKLTATRAELDEWEAGNAEAIAQLDMDDAKTLRGRIDFMRDYLAKRAAE